MPHLKKGSAAAKAYMARIRDMRGKPASKRKANPANSPQSKKFQVRIISLSNKIFTRTVSAPSKDAARVKVIKLFNKKHPFEKWQSVTISVANKKLPPLSAHEKDSMKISARRKTNPRKRLTAAQKVGQASSPMYTSRRSQATKKPATPRLQRRRARNTKVGAFPNPIGHHVIAIEKSGKIGYFDGFDGFDTSKAKAISYPTFQAATKAAQLLAPKIGSRAQLAAVSRNATLGEIRAKAGIG